MPGVGVAGGPPRRAPKSLGPQGKFPPRRSFHDAPFRWLVRFWFFYEIGRRLGFASRLRCPACAAVGTFKPFGNYWLDRDVRRWLCKWCGYYDGTDGIFWAAMDREVGTWILPVDEGRESFARYVEKVHDGTVTTPQKIANHERFNPWAG